MFTTKYRARKFINQPAKLLYEAGYEDLPPWDPSSGDVAPPPVGPTSDPFPFMAPTLNSPSFTSFEASLSVVITSCSFVVELIFSARSTVILPHLGKDIN